MHKAISFYLTLLMSTLWSGSHASTLAAVEFEEIASESDAIVRVHVTDGCADCDGTLSPGRNLATLQVVHSYKGAFRANEVFELKRWPDKAPHYVWGPLLKKSDEGILFLRHGDEGYYAQSGYRAFQRIAGRRIETINFVHYPRTYDLAQFERRLRAALTKNDSKLK